MVDGTVAERGTHDALMGARGVYFTLQQRGRGA